MKKNNQDKKRTKKIILFTKIIKISLMIILLFSFSYFLMNMAMKHNNQKGKELDKILKDINEVRSKMNDIERRAMLTKRYIDTWNNVITEKQKEKDGIDIEYIKKLITDIVARYPISNLNMSFSIPTDISYISRIIVSVFNTEITISFDCLTEYDAYHFFSDLFKNKDIFFVVEKFEIRRTKNINKDFIQSLINNGFNNNGLFSVNIKIQWFEFSGK